MRIDVRIKLFQSGRGGGITAYFKPKNCYFLLLKIEHENYLKEGKNYLIRLALNYL